MSRRERNPVVPDDVAGLALRLWHERRWRDRHFQRYPDLFADPAWDLLLDLLIAESEGRTVSTTAACLASGVAASTALRYVHLLESQGLVKRVPDRRDARRVLVQLSSTGRREMIAYLRLIQAQR
ncbi:MarR family transcriptional regulator [Sphingomonas abaci]|uniref:HTH marR-type domain-containing protein n=1 Tax=Sphingomonas abaci TaxID=237611 RepID=A0A7W7AJN3_9SPHN|nr:MarR family transcriptional regulator [Sphingomonas abaci]MBB4618265.1 hypothetical protein [Sphingomonas abaci]